MNKNKKNFKTIHGRSCFLIDKVYRFKTNSE